MARTDETVEVREDACRPAAEPGLPWKPEGRYLGPAHVVSASEDGDRVFVTLDAPGSPPGAWARVALQDPPVFCPDDQVLVIGDCPAGFYVIGLLGRRPHRAGPLQWEYDRTEGRTRMSVEGDLEFVARSGNISFVSDKGIRWVARRIESTADTLVERVKNLYRTVEDLSQTKAGRVRMLVSSTFRVKAKRAVVKADETCAIDAGRIDIG